MCRLCRITLFQALHARDAYNRYKRHKRHRRSGIAPCKLKLYLHGISAPSVAPCSPALAHVSLIYYQRADKLLSIDFNRLQVLCSSLWAMSNRRANTPCKKSLKTVNLFPPRVFPAPGPVLPVPVTRRNVGVAGRRACRGHPGRAEKKAHRIG